MTDLAKLDMLALEEILIDRLVDAEIPAIGRRVWAIAGLQDEQQIKRKVGQHAALLIHYGGHRVAETRGNGASTRILQTWTVLVVSRNARNIASGDGARDDAGPILSAVWAQLAGWKPGQGWGRMIPITPPAPRYGQGLFVHPLSFTSEISLITDY